MNIKCVVSTVVYKATINTGNESKVYIGNTEGNFKQRYFKTPQNRLQKHTSQTFNQIIRLHLETDFNRGQRKNRHKVDNFEKMQKIYTRK